MKHLDFVGTFPPDSSASSWGSIQRNVDVFPYQVVEDKSFAFLVERKTSRVQVSGESLQI